MANFFSTADTDSDDDYGDLLFDPDFEIAAPVRELLEVLPFGAHVARHPTDFEDTLKPGRAGDDKNDIQVFYEQRPDRWTACELRVDFLRPALTDWSSS
jgi:hypothetical protein